MKKIKVVIKNPGQRAYTTWISNTLKNLQRTVGGPIETVTLSRDIVIICNEEGRIQGLPFSCIAAGVCFVGTIIFAGIEGEEFADLPCKVADLIVDSNVIITAEELVKEEQP